jgi:copper chaperone CopZ
MKIKIQGMMCDHCTAHVKEALTEIKSLSNITVSLQDSCAIADGTADHQTIKHAIADAGYDVTAIED